MVRGHPWRTCLLAYQGIRSAALGHGIDEAIEQRGHVIRTRTRLRVTLEAEGAITEYERSARMLGWTMGKPASDRRLGLRFG